MLTVKTYIDKSSINGIGCFADEFIEKNQIIWVLNNIFDVVMTIDQYNSLPIHTKDYMKHFAYYNEGEGGYVLCSDNAKYFNHSKDPNCIADGIYTRASRDIQKGEEILENYLVFDELASEKLPSYLL